MPQGEVAAETIVAFVDSRVATMRHPGRIIEVLPASDIMISRAPWARPTTVLTHWAPGRA